jgi:hypothetical protein
VSTLRAPTRATRPMGHGRSCGQWSAGPAGRSPGGSGRPRCACRIGGLAAGDRRVNQSLSRLPTEIAAARSRLTISKPWLSKMLRKGASVNAARRGPQPGANSSPSSRFSTTARSTSLGPNCQGALADHRMVVQTCPALQGHRRSARSETPLRWPSDLPVRHRPCRHHRRRYPKAPGATYLCLAQRFAV